MNLFLLARTPKEAAQLHCDKHVVKMLLEAVQMLYAALALWGEPLKEGVVLPSGEVRQPYKATHTRHPCTLWTAGCVSHYEWVVWYARGLAEEYSARYGRTHLCSHHLEHIACHVKKNGYPRGMPQAVTALDWLKWTQGFVARASLQASRIAEDSAPWGTAFGVLAVDPSIKDIIVRDATTGRANAVETYRRLYGWKADGRVTMRWSKQTMPPKELASYVTHAVVSHAFEK